MLNPVKMLEEHVPRWLQRLPVALYRRVFALPLTTGQISFIERNSAFWRHYSGGHTTSANTEYLLVPVEGHTAIYVSDASFASIAAQAQKLRVLFVTPFSKNSVNTRILKSYCGGDFLHQHSWRFTPMKVGALISAFRAYRSMRTPQDLLGFQVDGIRFGDSIYDSVLAQGYATVDVVDRRVLLPLVRFYFLRGLIKHIIKRYDIRASVFALTIGPRGTTFSRYLLKHKIEVINRVGSHQLHAKKYRTLSDLGFYPLRPEQKYFELMLRRDDGTLQRTADEYLDRRMNRDIRQLAVDAAYDPRKNTFTDRLSFCKQYHLDHSKPIVFVMIQAFNDWPHSHLGHFQHMFQDYYHWFARTLEIAGKVKSVNWVFKEHPAAHLYPTKDIDLREVFGRIHSDHILFLDRTADFNTRSLRHLAHAIVTCTGTAGVEYSPKGIPCVLGAASGFAGFGFTIEPQSEKDYETCLASISELPRLNAEQRRAASIVAYFWFCVVDTVYHFCPGFTDKELPEWDAELDQSFWERAAAQFADDQHVGKMRRQVEDLSRFVCDRTTTQYIDLSKFPMFQRNDTTQDKAAHVVSTLPRLTDFSPK